MVKVKKMLMSLRLQMMLIVLLCWLLPVLMVLSVMSSYFSDTVGKEAEQALVEQFQVNLQMCTDRVNSAAEASRLASYDPTIRQAWDTYQRDGNYAALYRDTRAFLNRQYASDSRFRFSVFWFSEDPDHMTLTTLAGVSGTMYTQISRYWPDDFVYVRELAAGLDTDLGFLERDGRLYLVRNQLDSHYNIIGVLVLALNQPYYFEELTTLDWASSMEVQLGKAAPIALKGEYSGQGEGAIQTECQGSGYQITARADIDYRQLLAPFRSYTYVLMGMALLLFPLMLFTFQFLQRKVSQPIQVLMDGASQIEAGHLGYQLSYKANSREFQYITDSFNHMSGRLQQQFDRIYQEEVALRDARIKALQAHINPHFLNNTLEIINWEARMNGDAKVSKMIEALSTVLDAALDRKKSPEVRLAEEMTYVNAYLYIIDQRFGKRLTISIDLPQELMEFRVPRLILQPVIENAVEHGTSYTGQGTVAIRGYRQDRYLILEIENGGGMSEKDEEHIRRLLSPDYEPDRENSGNIGIANVNQRLRILYGGDCGLSLFRGEGEQVVARLKIALSEDEIVYSRGLSAIKDNK